MGEERDLGEVNRSYPMSQEAAARFLYFTLFLDYHLQVSYLVFRAL